jgi:hypothetical protein
MLRFLGLPASMMVVTVAGLAQAHAGELRFWVDNLAGFSQPDLAQAQSSVHEVFRWTGVEVTFAHCMNFAKADPACAARSFQKSDLFLGLVPAAARVVLARSSEAAGASICGAVGDPGGRILVFKPDIDKLISENKLSRSDLGIMLGYVIAHEAGHLLLGCSAGHSISGIMMALWERAEMQKMSMGFLRFTDEESDRIRASVQRWNASDRLRRAAK